MRIGIVVDSACDLPAEFIHRHGIEILAQHVRIGDAVHRDHHDDEVHRKYLLTPALARERSIETLAPTVEQVRRLLLERWVVHYDHVFCLTTSSRRSPLHRNVVQAGFAILNDYHAVRQAAGHASPFALRVITRTACSSARASPRTKPCTCAAWARAWCRYAPAWSISR